MAYHRFLLDRIAQHDPRKPALVDGLSGRQLTFGEFKPLVEAFGAWLLRRGFGKGHTLAIVSHNIPEYAVVFHVRRRHTSPFPPHLTSFS